MHLGSVVACGANDASIVGHLEALLHGERYEIHTQVRPIGIIRVLAQLHPDLLLLLAAQIGDLHAVARPVLANELLQRMIIVHRLTREHLEQIVEIQLRRLRGLLAKRKLTLELTEKARRFLADAGYDPVYGARPLKRAIQRHLQDGLALALLQGEFSEEDTIVADVAGDKLAFHKRVEAEVV